MNDLDSRLAALATLAPPAELADIERAVWAGISQARSDRRQLGVASCAAVAMALLAGVAGGVSIEDAAPTGLIDASLAPSSLLTASL
ncbi:hypothetical protein M9980_09785 [Sphingomonas donggukensis]|uniref:Uncharacterized protein n=1 Tax=Sphingomonas donggukensis TaxID=2949093 RepID=A0ABY4TWE6_9SPHN|nr:hypothetical protein [Sphingomonas donggukensis]URW74856.1 hypothetical protein M9980_09785 [Sphingomonas donggukensis]